MREPLICGDDGYARYKDDNLTVFSLLDGKPVKWIWKKDTLSQLYMPKVAARTFKRYEFIRVEKVQDISEEDAVAEGIQQQGAIIFINRTITGILSIDCFAKLWDEINAKRGYPWDENPWVWVIGYVPCGINEIEKSVENRCSLGIRNLRRQ
jgi:hypothetical protein